MHPIIIFSRFIKATYKERKGLKILDIGCGTGSTIKELERFGDVLGVDIEPQALYFCKKKGVSKTILAEGNYLPCKDKTFDLVTLFNIIEHIEDDRGFVREVHRVLKDNGKIVIATSAFNFLWSKHDVVNEHKRRYTKTLLKRLIGKQFTVERMTYTNFILFPAIWIGIIFNNIIKRKKDISCDGFYPVPGFINKILLLILKLESILLKRFNFPYGVSLLCIAEKN